MTTTLSFYEHNHNHVLSFVLLCDDCAIAVASPSLEMFPPRDDPQTCCGECGEEGDIAPRDSTLIERTLDPR